MERLAAQGVRFSNFYSHNVCSPMRISITTGQNSARHRTTDWINPYQNNRDMDKKRFPQAIARRVPPEWNWEGLGKEDVTLPAILKQAGYTTIHKATSATHSTTWRVIRANLRTSRRRIPNNSEA
jgi:arylsulfatase A-like enzyme